MSEALNKALAFLDTAVAELDRATRLAPNGSLVERRRSKRALDIPTKKTGLPRVSA